MKVFGKVGLPKQFEWHAADILGRPPPPTGEFTHREVQDILVWCSLHMPDNEGQDLINLLAVHKTKAELLYFDYDWTFTVSTATYQAPAGRPARYLVCSDELSGQVLTAFQICDEDSGPQVSIPPT